MHPFRFIAACDVGVTGNGKVGLLFETAITCFAYKVGPSLPPVIGRSPGWVCAVTKAALGTATTGVLGEPLTTTIGTPSAPDIHDNLFPQGTQSSEADVRIMSYNELAIRADAPQHITHYWWSSRQFIYKYLCSEDEYKREGGSKREIAPLSLFLSPFLSLKGQLHSNFRQRKDNAT